MAPPVGGYYAWYDATQITGVADGTVLTNWPDASGNGHNLTAHTGTPTFYKTTTANLINGNPTVFFNADGHLASGAAFSLPQPFTVFVIAKQTSIAFHDVWGEHADSVIMWANSGTWHMYASSAVLAGGTADTNVHCLTGQFNGASSLLRVDGTTVASGDPGSVGVSTVFVIGDETDAGGGSPFQGPIGELVIYPSALSPTDTASVESYLTAKWASPPAVTGTAALPLGPLSLTSSGGVPIPSGTATAVIGPVALTSTDMVIDTGTVTLTVGPVATTATGTPFTPYGYANCNLGPLVVSIGAITDVCTRRAWLTLGNRLRWLQDESAGYFCTSLDLGYPTVRAVVNDRPQMSGTIDRTKYMGARAVTANITAVAGAGAIIDQVAADFAPFMDPSARPVLHYIMDRAPGIERTLTLRGSGYSWPIQGPYQRDIQLAWVAPDPISRDPQVKSVSASPTSVGTISSPGEVDVFPLIRLYGPITGPVIALVPSDLGSWYLAFVSSFVIGSGHWVDIDTSARSALLDGDPAQPVLSFFDWTRTTWQSVPAAPSSTNLSLTGTGTTTATNVIASWQDGYLT